MTYHDEESGREEVFVYDNGMHEYFDERCMAGAEPIPASGWHIAPKWEGGEAQIILGFASDGQGQVMESFANMIPTIQGGTHVKALRDAVSGAVRNVADTLGLMPKNLTVTKDDATAALSALISIRVEEPSFAGQTKERLSNNEFVGEMTTQVRDELERLMNKHPAEAQAIVELAIERAQARVKASKTVKRKKG